MTLPRPCLLLPLLALLVLARPAAAAGGEDAKLEAFFKAYLDRMFQQQPTAATRLGDHRFDHLLEDLAPAARAAWVERDRAALAELPRRVDVKKLSRGGQIDYEIFAHHLTYSVWLAENTHPFEE